MKTLAQLQMRVFLRRWPLMLLAGLTLLGVVVAGVYEFHLATLAGGAVVDALANFTRYQIVVPLMVAVLTYEFTCAPRVAAMEEAVEAHPVTAHKHWLALMAPPSALVVVIFVTYTSIKLCVVYANHVGGLLAGHLIAEAVLDVLAPSVIGMLLGALAARRLSRYSGYAAIVVFAALIGPYAEMVPMLAQAGIANGGSGVNLYPVYDLFRVLAPDPTWGMDALYGFPLEMKRWALVGVWILGMLAVFLPAITSSKRRGARPARAVLAVLAVLCLVGALLPGSVLRRDFRFFGGSSIPSEQIYYQIQAGRHPEREQPADFNVDRYDIHMKAGRQLSATVSMDLSGSPHEGPYRFTLYHGYHVERAWGAGGEALGIVQEGDYITITASGELRRVTFEYSGNGGICIANHQGVFLPGYFPYYPVPGFVRVWDDLRLAPVADVAGDEPSQFVVEFDAFVPLASNLELRNGRFEGRTVAPSFVGGLVAQATVADQRVVYYPTSGVTPGGLPGLIERLRELERSLGVTESLVPARATFIQMPGLAQGETVVLPDTILLTGIDQSLAADILVAATPMRLERENLKEAFARVLNDPGSLDDLQSARPTDGEIARLEKARLSAHSDMETVQSYCYPAKNAVFWLFREKLREEGLEDALRDTYTYISSDSTMSELGFLSRRDTTEAQ